jgi:arylsulfatase A-like enzyme
MKRKALLALAATLLAWPGCKASSKPTESTPSQTTRRPNFLFIYTDDQRYDGVGCIQREMGDRARFPWFTTPNMDRIAAEGMRFHNAFVVNSLCAPSRSCFLTGQYSHLNGVANNHTPMPEDIENSAKILTANGYATAYIGKFHHAHQIDRPGFAYIASYLGQGNYYGSAFNVNGQMQTPSGWVDDAATDYTIRYLQDHMRDHPDQPFDIVLGFKSPHDPRTPPPRAARRFADHEYASVPNLNIPSIYPPGKAKWMGTWLLPKTQLDYFRCISAVDDDLGRILTALDRLHLSDNTVVIYTTDNGIYLGEHELADKRTAYDESLRIPLLLRWPGHVPPGKVVDQMALNIDLPETLLDLAGAKIPATMQGMSWQPLWTESHPHWRNAFFYEYFKENGYDAPQTLAVRTDNAKLIKYPDHPEWTELFNLKTDPYETHNLANDPASADLLQKMETKFAQQKSAVKFRVPPYADPQNSPENNPNPKHPAG